MPRSLLTPDTLIDLAAARRLTRLIVKDEITRPMREAVEDHAHEKLAYLVNCPYCVSVYTSAFITLSGILFPRASKPFRYALAIAEAQATLTDVENQRSALNQDYGPGL